MKVISVLMMMMFFLISCESGNIAPHDTRYIDLSIRDIDNNDMLNPGNEHCFKENEIKIFYETDGQKVEVFEANLRHPRYFYFYQYQEEYRIKIFLNPNHDEKSEYVVTYIKWNNVDEDTIKSVIKRQSKHTTVHTDILYNDSLIYSDILTERYARIIK
ncbi:MAG: hypothetical protein LBC19_00475 [Tannerella sp.]|jgi:hypothetical protein|nr:hypothetical protein [Tannerella sp.]